MTSGSARQPEEDVDGGKNARYDIFICYRRDGGAETAKHLRDVLVERGYRVFFDTDSLRSGDFNRALLDVIEGCTDFIIILSPGSLDRCENDGDWVRKELSWALSKDKNVIPIMSGSFEFPKTLPPDINGVRWKNGIVVNVEYFDAMIDKLVTFLLSKRTIRKRSLLPLVTTAVLAFAVGASLLWLLGGKAPQEGGGGSVVEEQVGSAGPQDDEQSGAPPEAEETIDLQPEATSTAAEEAISDDEYILPESSTRYYTREELEQLSDWELWMARNEIYARHGRKFNSQEAQDYFYGKSWYVGLYDPNEYDRAGVPQVYNDYERYNRALIEQIEAERESPYAD